jgi:hypothetical protein
MTTSKSSPITLVYSPSHRALQQEILRMTKREKFPALANYLVYTDIQHTPSPLETD